MYAVAGESAVGTTKTQVSVTCATGRMGLIYLSVGSGAAPADLTTNFALARTSTAGTGTARTAQPFDPLTKAAVGAPLITLSAEPTIAANTDLLQFAANQRAPSWQFQTDKDGALYSVITASNGLGVRSIASGGTYNVNTTIHWIE